MFKKFIEEEKNKDPDTRFCAAGLRHCGSARNLPLPPTGQLQVLIQRGKTMAIWVADGSFRFPDIQDI